MASYGAEQLSRFARSANFTRSDEGHFGRLLKVAFTAPREDSRYQFDFRLLTRADQHSGDKWNGRHRMNLTPASLKMPRRKVLKHSRYGLFQLTSYLCVLASLREPLFHLHLSVTLHQATRSMKHTPASLMTPSFQASLREVFAAANAFLVWHQRDECRARTMNVANADTSVSTNST